MPMADQLFSPEALIARSVAPVKRQYLRVRAAAVPEGPAAGAAVSAADAAAAAQPEPASAPPADAVTTGGEAAAKKSRSQLKRVRVAGCGSSVVA